MLTISQIILEDNNSLGVLSSTENELVVNLQKILAREQLRQVSYEEAIEVSEALISFFELLAQPKEATDEQ